MSVSCSIAEVQPTLKALLDEPRLQIMPGCGDGMGAHLIEEAGFRTGFISGSSISGPRGAHRLFSVQGMVL
jgi:2-methylisocitrate lyase-like PEP mutase family enzyme